MNRKGFYYVVFLVTVCFSVFLLITGIPPCAYQDLEVTDENANIIATRFNDKTVTIGLDTLKGLVKNEDERFRHIDTKATAFIGMLSISLTLFTSLGTLAINTISKKASTSSEEMAGSGGQKPIYPKYLLNMLKYLYFTVLFALLASFFVAMLSTRVPSSPSSNFIGVEIATRYDVDPEVVIGREYIGLDRVSYQKVLIAEFAKVYAKNVHANNVKARWLSFSQLLALVAGVVLVGTAVTATGIIWPPPNENTPSPSETVITRIIERCINRITL